MPFQCWTFQRSYTERAMDGFGACPMLATARGGGDLRCLLRKLTAFKNRHC